MFSVVTSVAREPPTVTSVPRGAQTQRSDACQLSEEAGDRSVTQMRKQEAQRGEAAGLRSHSSERPSQASDSGLLTEHKVGPSLLPLPSRSHLESLRRRESL